MHYAIELEEAESENAGILIPSYAGPAPRQADDAYITTTSTTVTIQRSHVSPTSDDLANSMSTYTFRSSPCHLYLYHPPLALP